VFARTGASASSIASRSSLALTHIGNPGDNEIFWLEVDGGITPTTPGTETWTQLGVITHSAGYKFCAWIRRVLAGETGTATGTFSFTANFSQGGIVAYSGAFETGSPLSGTPTTNTAAGNSTSETALSVTTADASALVVALGMNIDATNTHPSATQGTQDQDASCAGVYSFVKAAAGASGNNVITVSPAVEWGAIMFALKPGTPVAQPNVIITQPATTGGVSPASAASAWGSGAWLDLLPAGWDFDIAVHEIELKTPAAPTLATTFEALIEIATGASGSETVIAQIPWTFRNVTAVDYIQGDPIDIGLPEPITVTAGTRVAVRISDSHTSALTYTGVKVAFRELASGGAASLTAALAGTGAITANLTAGPRISSTLAGAGTITATLTAAPLMTAAPVGAGTISGALTASPRMTAALAGAGTINATLSAAALLSTALAGAGSITAGITAASLLSGSLVGAGSVNGNLTIPGSANLAATLAGQGAIAAALTASSLMTAALTGGGALTPALTAPPLMTGTLAGAGSLTGGLTASPLISAALVGQGALAAALAVSPQLTAALTGAGTLAGALTANALLATTLGGAGSISANLTVPGGAALVAAVVGQGSIAAGLSASARLTVTLTGAGVVVATLTTPTSALLVATLAGSGTLTGALTASTRISAALGGAGTIAAALTASALLTASLAGAGQIAAALSIVPLVVAVGRFEGGLLIVAVLDGSTSTQIQEAGSAAAFAE
jgi:hypothetical protein